MSKKDKTNHDSGLTQEDLDKIINADSSDDKNEILQGRDGRPTVVKIIVALIALVALIAGVLLLNPSTSPFFGDKKTKVNTAAQEPAVVEVEVDEAWWMKTPNSTLPFKMADWQKYWSNPDASNFTKKQSDYFRSAVADTKFYAKADMSLLSGDNITSDTSKAMDEKGIPNPDFAYVTGDLFFNESGDILHRLLNPLYGGWADYQFADANAAKNFNTAPFRGVFTDKLLNKFSGKNLTQFPVYADWAGNDYGRDDLVPIAPARWFGKVKSADVLITYDKRTMNHTFDATYQVEFTAKTMEQKTVTKQGVLKVRYITETEVAPYNPTMFRILADDAKLTIK